MSASRPVCLAAVSEVLGGAEVYTLELAAALQASTAVSIAAGPGSPLARAASERGIPVRELAIGPKLSRRTAVGNTLRARSARQALRRLFDAGAPSGEIVVLQYKWEQILWAGELDPDRVVVLEHGPVPPPVTRIPVVCARLRAAYRAASVMAAVSATAARSLGAVSDRTPEILEAGVDTERAGRARDARSVTRASLGVADWVPLAVYAGRLDRKKGVVEFVEAVRRAPDLHAVVAGDGPARDDVRSVADQAGGRIHLLGHVDDAMPVLAAGDASVLLSGPVEGRGLAAMESLAVGTPVIGLRSSGALAELALSCPDGVSLVERPFDVPGAVRQAHRSPRPAPADLPTWDATARRFLALVGASAARPMTEVVRA